MQIEHASHQPAVRLRPLALVLVAACVAALPAAVSSDEAKGPMELERMDAIIREHATSVLRSGGSGATGNVWEFDFFGVRMACVADSRHNRMRVLAPVVALRKLTPEQHLKVLEANFHTALDARYAASEGVLYSLFLHPLGSLSDSQLRSALLQVAALTRSFGGDYSSGTLRYGEPGTTM